MNPIFSALTGPSGKISANRSLTAIVVLCVMGTWATVSIQKREIQQLSKEEVALVLGTLLNQSYHKAQEKKPNANDPR